jgi:excisionase family DNA binding protein
VPDPRTRTTRRSGPSAALFVRVPAEQARRLDRAAFELGRPKQELVSTLLERYVDPDSPVALAELTRTGGKADEGSRRRVTVETLEPGGLTLGHHSFRPREPDVLTGEQAAELLQVDPEVVLALADSGELPGRCLGGEWRFARSALLDWLAGGAPPPATEPPARTETNDR